MLIHTCRQHGFKQKLKGEHSRLWLFISRLYSGAIHQEVHHMIPAMVYFNGLLYFIYLSNLYNHSSNTCASRNPSSYKGLDISLWIIVISTILLTGLILVKQHLLALGNIAFLGRLMMHFLSILK